MPVARAGADRRGRPRGPRSRLRRCLERRRAGEQQHQVGVQRARGPDLLAADHVAVVRRASPSSGSASCRSRRVGSVTPKACRRSSPAGDPRQVALPSAPRCRAAAACPSCTSARGRRRSCSRAALISSRITPAAVSAEARRRRTPRGSAPPASRCSVRAATNSLGVAVGLELAPVLARGSPRRARGRPHGSRRAPRRSRRSRCPRTLFGIQSGWSYRLRG